ncbi:MAG: hypothetical protein K0Q79_2753 [Flavipsychrobacter sp.]|jgi:hypothetical protein|nr:hypothetical protein [Flavipsychrobacter sp.]
MNPYDIIYNEKLGELLKDVQFIFDTERHKIHVPTFNTFVVNALKYHTETTLDCSLSEYKQVYRNASLERKWFMPEMFVALQAVKSLPPKDSLLGTGECLDIEMYIERREDWDYLLNQWNTIAAPYMAEARKFAEDKAKRDQRELQTKSKLVQLNGQRLGK